MPRTKPPEPATPPPQRRADLFGLFLATVGVLLLAGLLRPDGAFLGPMVRGLEFFLGRLSVAVPFLFLYAAARCLIGGPRPPAPSVGVGLVLICIAAAGFFHLQVPVGEELKYTLRGDGFLHPPDEYGGIVGAVLVRVLRLLLGRIGCPAVLGMVAVAGLITALECSVQELWQAFGRWMRARVRDAQALVAARRAARHAVAAAPQPALGAPVDFHPPVPIVQPVAVISASIEPAPPAAAPPPRSRNKANGTKPNQMTLPGMPVDHNPYEDEWYAEGEPTSYRPPPLRLVEPPASAPLPDRSPEIRANSERLESTFASFQIQAHVVNTEIGPTVTRYELELAPGIRVSKVANLADDIALALASTGIRIQAPVPGKGVIGIEVPNQVREIVHLHSILSSKEFRTAPGPLSFVVGKDIAGQIRLAELTRMPHVLIAGITNSGKSVCLNTLIISLLYRLSPRELRFLMIDPKRVELTLYDGIPHLDRPVVTDPEDAADLLRGAVREMMARYDRLHALGVRNITNYNQMVDEGERMPYIVIIIDELAELMMLNRAEVEGCVCRVAQLARATGIHLVIATQRPSVNIVTGSIKANIGTRIAFAVRQQVDSRVILDEIGAERLIGRGDMLYAPIESGDTQRLQGAYVDEFQVHALVDYLKAMPSTLRVQYGDSIIQPVAADAVGEEALPEVTDADLDELFWDCVRFVRAEGEASTSRLQRNFEIGYNRAGRIMDQMFKMGIVGPPNGSRPRQVTAGGPREATAPDAGDDDLDLPPMMGLEDGEEL
ncbi:MAG: DNA translocase FtsK 4TM domain-containing protein [Armatimonadetes bacterium]|nr:DNA translocase FtsK 4TM domain-containing protein [Armatimonadota bacterium]